MKLSTIATLFVSPIIVLTTAPGFAEEMLERYSYNDNGTYQKAGAEEIQTVGDQNSGSSAGHIEVKGGYAKSYDWDNDGTIWNLRGSYAQRFANRFNFQLDADYDYFDTNLGDGGTFSGAVHLAYQQPDNYAFGVFGQLGVVEDNSDITNSNFGAEAAIFQENVTYHGRVGYNNINFYGYDFGGVFVQGGIRYFAQDNLRLDFDGRYQDGLTQLTATGNYRFQDNPVSVFAGYTYENVDYGSLGNYDGGLIFAGLRIHFDSNTLREEERNGLIWSKIQ